MGRAAGAAAACIIAAFAAVAATSAAAAGAPAQVRLTLTSEPSGAAVSIDGQNAGATPLTAMAAPGRRLVEMRLDGHEPAYVNVTAAGDAMAEHIRLVPTTATVLVHSRPEGASVTLNGSNAGVTPLLLPEVAVGVYRIGIALDGYKPQKVDLTVAGSRPQRINAELISSSASLNVTSEPGEAYVSVNGIARGKTPISVDQIPEGLSTVDVTADGYFPYSKELQLVAGERFTLHAPLQAKPANLSIVTIPDGARVYFENEYRGDSPVSIKDLKAGTYRVRVEKDAYETMARDVTLANDQTLTEEFRMAVNVGNLMVATSPADVTIIIGGKEIGKTIAKKEETDQISEQLRITSIPIGTHEVKFSRKGYAEATQTVEIKRDETTTMETVLLQRQFIPDVEVTTEHGVYRGVFIDKNTEVYRIATTPGVVRSFFNKDIKGIRIIRDDNVEKGEK